MTIHIRAPSRLHFGLFSFGTTGRQYGGVGIMVRHPELRLLIRPRNDGQVRMSHTERMAGTVRRWLAFRQRNALPPCDITIEVSPPVHVGLGSGTQLALALVAGLDALCDQRKLDPRDLASAAARGQRSAVGTYGFVMGGMIIEKGRLPEEVLAPLECRLAIPKSWRFLLVRPTRCRGLSGVAEQRTFRTLPPVSDSVRQMLIRIAHDQIGSAVRHQDFDQFAAGLYDYGRHAGNCFASYQGGPYNGPVLTSLVDQIRELGLQGVGQSSWGPTLFAAAPDEDTACRARDALRIHHAPGDLHIDITGPDNLGARVEYRQVACE